MIQLSPGNFLDNLRQNPQISEETLKQFQQQFGLDKPVVQQYFLWLRQVVTRLDFGVSFAYAQRPVTEILWERIPATLLLSLASLFITWTIAIPMGIVGAVKQNQGIDRFPFEQGRVVEDCWIGFYCTCLVGG
ncbi:hypothetical protein [Leptolyngbya ohadii]|uniref:hypothetical protein n=1 Tax=Leptolyngbya ohadii TaxID=1962290 RepID=UPI000B59BAE4|nr:hypothetical protein [Leptolyngbya ohadii]